MFLKFQLMSIATQSTAYDNLGEIMKASSLLISLIALLAIFSFAGQMDFDDIQAEQEHYCEMVKMKAWPDYQGTYKQYCR